MSNPYGASAQTYRIQSVMTASAAQRVAMLYDRAITWLQEAKAAIERGDVKARHDANNHAGEIIVHLQATLDLEKGGEIAANLSRLYRFMLNRMIQIDLRNDAKAADDVIGLLRPLSEAWHALDAQIVAEAGASGRASGQQGYGQNAAAGAYSRVSATA
ncbi:MAG: flagellar export chaperone FliS [Tistrella sp.]|jgi:flagellar protein FliS|uniref:Flagellar export chaperone FliS n=1 Tax=Tistrella mobilis TaxID=171437 RepID=A0A3B9ILS1_9PROT|nr:flagellar export chaperone FliS [Tistrella sp.]MAD39959.1 flagellar export chaperone FliS [Tistrella sp.]MBA77145.1 flagellar export chaperone FliS [Tistrella sp.]HAE48814.1 flagellar export chaperone FliS [Tistrella mobilis]|tara:strand:+ start:3252 stop:3728 length:477 start_codon:yes stop_codon:yes gene_type:complete